MSVHREGVNPRSMDSVPDLRGYNSFCQQQEAIEVKRLLSFFENHSSSKSNTIRRRPLVCTWFKLFDVRESAGFQDLFISDFVLVSQVSCQSWHNVSLTLSGVRR